jgi:hypothetical protein
LRTSTGLPYPERDDLDLNWRLEGAQGHLIPLFSRRGNQQGCRGESRTAATDSTVRQGFQVVGLWVPALLESASQIEETFALTVTGHHEARQDAMNQRSPEGFVAAAHLAGDDPRPQHLFGVVVGRWYFRIVLAGLLWAGLAIESPAVMTTNPRNGVVVILAEAVATSRPLFRSAPDVEAGVKEESR